MPGNQSHDSAKANLPAGPEALAHVSILKFIERNWNLPTISNRSRDNLPNPRVEEDNPYVPQNTPAISDLFDLFTFGND